MKGAQGIMIAVAMGVVGFVCNWLYLEREASRVELVSFVGVSQPADVKRGDVIQSDDLVPISMPKSHESQLAQVAVLWDQRDLVIGQKAARDLAVSGAAELVMHRDLTTPAIKDINELIADNERVMWLPVDSRTFNPQHVDPGDQVSFRIPEFGKGASRSQPTEAGGKILGPFRILALGNRKGRRAVRRPGLGRRERDRRRREGRKSRWQTRAQGRNPGRDPGGQQLPGCPGAAPSPGQGQTLGLHPVSLPSTLRSTSHESLVQQGPR